MPQSHDHDLPVAANGRIGLPYRDYVAGDASPPPADIVEEGGVDLGIGGVPRDRYLSPQFHRLELERMWPRVWQLACREEEIPEVGDVHVYELADYSILVVRSAPDEIKAYFNSCLHRGTKLCADHTHVKHLRCPFHGFTWSLDGRLKEVPCRWDFPQVTDEGYRLPEARVGRWGGFVFVNMDPEAPPLDTYLGNLTSHLGRDGFEDKYIAGYYRKVLPANWKAAIEAFIEAYHTSETHPQGMPFTDYGNAQYDVWPGNKHISRFMHAFGIQSPDLERKLTQQEILETLYTTIWGEPAPALPPDVTARAFFATEARRRMTAETGRDYAWASDAESIDSLEYFVFPNTMLFRGIFVPLVYRFRPNGHDPNSCIFDLILLKDVPLGQPRPEAAEPIEMGDKTYTEQLGGFFGMVYDQDTQNLWLQQQGMKTSTRPELTLAGYQETRIRHLHETLNSYLNTVGGGA